MVGVGEGLEGLAGGEGGGVVGGAVEGEADNLGDPLAVVLPIAVLEGAEVLEHGEEVAVGLGAVGIKVDGLEEVAEDLEGEDGDLLVGGAGLGEEGIAGPGAGLEEHGVLGLELDGDVKAVEGGGRVAGFHALEGGEGHEAGDEAGGILRAGLGIGEEEDVPAVLFGWLEADAAIVAEGDDEGLVGVGGGDLAGEAEEDATEDVARDGGELGEMGEDELGPVLVGESLSGEGVVAGGCLE